MLRTMICRTFKAAVVGCLGALVIVWFRRRQGGESATEPEPAQWPPLKVAVGAEDDAPPIEEPSDGAAAAAPEGDWVDPDPEGDCPLSHPVKTKLRSGIYHLPGGASYDRTNADRCYTDAGAAESDGYRGSKT
jgi:hypothetical protein